MTHRQSWSTHSQKGSWLRKGLKTGRIASVFLTGLALALGTQHMAQAASPETAPAELVGAIERIETAASAGDVEAVMAGYSPEFANEDGFTYETLPAALEMLWSRYDTLTYRVELQSWEPEGTGYSAETLTYINGTQVTDGQPMALESVIRSQQSFVGGKIMSQETLSERNQVTSGTTPPTISVILPEQVNTGESYDFDAIVMEPLGNRYLLGAAVEEGVSATDFFTGRPV
ncbi:MAG: hypothetical protein AAFP03_14375, partial [Cyanobacteria bacterium J06598_3]